MTADALAEETRSARRKALRALLSRPLRAAGADDEELRLIRRHAAELRAWLAAETGWRLIVDSDSARLFKAVAATGDDTYPARDARSRAPFGRRRYVLLCLALSVLEAADAQITLGRLAEGVLVAASDPALTDAGIVFTLGRRDERSDLVAVVRLLLSLGVLRRVAGDEEAYLAANGDVLYDVRRRVLATMLTGARGPSTVEAADFETRLTDLTTEPVPDTEDLRNRALRQRLTRRLLDEPVVYYDELTDEERAYLASQRPFITRRIEDATGLVAEVRAEGIAMVDPEDELTDVRMPEQRTDGHVTLLVAEYLAERLAADPTIPRPVPLSRLRQHVREQAAAHVSYWRKGVTDPGAEQELLDTALGKLRALRLVADVPVEPGGAPAVVARPAIARYAIDAPTIRDRDAHRGDRRKGKGIRR
ncbi:TIGR02678 family protein [Pseudofrankia asymbiotica]|uniref:TIGR02678 family protein n=1 Tax=Pseudofrankia asymbiotica TaxID=1834516 RepID=A0A1V2IEX2_9ACTN|nr:TIGR02678 family protein [Pseudofrankia asymbiotica]ONH31449.1 TIGR02678 family protein [Pseudofrankia asymbiotica]